MFQTVSRNTQGGTAHHIFNILFRQLGSPEEPFSEYEKNFEKPVNFRRCIVYKPVDALDEVVIRNNVQEFYIHRQKLQTINNLLSVLKTDIMSTIHQNSTRNSMIVTQKVNKFKNDA